MISAAAGQTTSSVNFGNVPVGSTLIVPAAITDPYKVNLTVTQATVSGTGFSFVGPNLPITLAPQQAASLSVSLAPQAGGSFSGTLAVTGLTRWGSPHHFKIALSGTGYSAAGYLTTPSSMNMGSVTVGSSQTQSLTLSNTGGSSLTISAATVSGTGFSVGGQAFPYTLAPGASTSLSITFAPTATGTDAAVITVSSNASNSSAQVPLSGSGMSSTGTLGVTPGSMSFGNVTIGTTQIQSGSLTASGGSVTLSSASSSNTAFTVGGLTLPVTISSGQSVPFTISFVPTTGGSASANISFFSASSSAMETASGSGGTIQHNIDLSWNASTSTSIMGYNVYRGTATGGPYSKINSALDPAMNYTDSTIQSGRTYYYVTTAVDFAGIESSYSSEAQAVVPFP